MNKLLIIIGSLVVALAIGLMITQPPEPSLIYPVITPYPTPKPLSAAKLEEMANIYRQGLNKPPLKHDELMCEIANHRLPEIQTDFTHDQFYSITETTYKQHSELAGIGENLAKDFYTEVDTFGAWLDSPTHKNNLDAYWETTCVKCEQTTCIQVFGRYFHYQTVSN
jgi:uncharacterized protein YkwD